MSDIKPPDTTPEYMYSAWASCLNWASGHEGIRKQFEADTGIKYTSPKSTIEAMIDDSSGFTKDVAVKFVEWFNEKVWGDVDAVPEED